MPKILSICVCGRKHIGEGLCAFCLRWKNIGGKLNRLYIKSGFPDEVGGKPLKRRHDQLTDSNAEIKKKGPPGNCKHCDRPVRLGRTGVWLDICGYHYRHNPEQKLDQQAEDRKSLRNIPFEEKAPEPNVPELETDLVLAA